MNKADMGLIGLAVMGENLALNIESKGNVVAVYNYTPEEITRFLENRGKDHRFIGSYTLEEFVDSLKKPRVVWMMIRAGAPVDSMIEKLIPLLDEGDILIDGGNSYFEDTIRRTKWVESKGLLYIGSGVSGGEEGALKGPSLMPGGSAKAWPFVEKLFTSISAQESGEPCCRWVGSDGAGHFVKMVHNGIEYGDMQLICEAYSLMKTYLGMSENEISTVFAEWNKGELKSYLIEITADILSRQDENGRPIVSNILDTAGQKGTGKWTSISALNEGIPLTLISEAVFSRCLSAIKEERVAASKILDTKTGMFTGNKEQYIRDIHDALYASKIVSYAQGYALLLSASKTYGWDLNFGDIALMWRGGCIIRSVFLGNIKQAFINNPELQNLMLDDFFSEKLKNAESSWRTVCASALIAGIPVPAFTSAISYYDSYRSAWLPANLLQAQRDYFGAHTYERVDKPRGEFFHTDWNGFGSAASSTYTV